MEDDFTLSVLIWFAEDEPRVGLLEMLENYMVVHVWTIRWY